MSDQRRNQDRIWTPEAIRSLGVTTDIETAAAILGIGRTLAFDLVRKNEFPVRLLRLGRRIVVPTSELRKYLGISE